MDYKNKNLLLNIPTRHVIDMTKENDGELRQQLKMLAKIDLNNFFILGSTETISKVFSVGNSLKLIGSKYAWYGLTKVSYNLFVTSKNEFSNSPILQFTNLKCCIKAKEPFKTPFNGVLVLIYYFKKHFKRCFLF